MTKSLGVKDQFFCGKHSKSRDIMTSLETKLVWVELAISDNHDRIGELVEGIERCSSGYE